MSDRWPRLMGAQSPGGYLVLGNMFEPPQAMPGRTTVKQHSISSVRIMGRKKLSFAAAHSGVW